MSNRKLTAFGVPPLLAYPLLLMLFMGLSTYLFSKLEFAVYVYLFLAIGLLTKGTHRKRNEFLKSCFSQKNYIIIRVLENLLVILPFVLFLIYQSSIVFIPVLLAFAGVFAYVNFNTTLHLTIPSPFYKKPFEFTVGFRNTFFIFPIAYVLTYTSISVGNFNLGVFSMLLVFLISLSYYSKLEDAYYIWSFNLAPKAFLTEKIKTGLLYTTVSILPIVIALALFFNSELETLLTFMLLGFAYLITLILAKYSVYPHEINIPQGILIAISLIFPPVLIGIIPYFYYQSSKRLNSILQ